MLRDSLQTLADTMARHRETGLVMEPVAVAAFQAILDSCAAEAEALEEAAQRHFQGHGLPEDVVRIATLLARNGVSAGMPARPAVANAGGAA